MKWSLRALRDVGRAFFHASFFPIGSHGVALSNRQILSLVVKMTKDTLNHCRLHVADMYKLRIVELSSAETVFVGSRWHDCIDRMPLGFSISALELWLADTVAGVGGVSFGTKILDTQSGATAARPTVLLNSSHAPVDEMRTVRVMSKRKFVMDTLCSPTQISKLSNLK